MIRALTIILVLLAPPALAHSWYPPECCNDGDCRPVPCGEVSADQYGNPTWKGKLFRHAHASQDGHCHVCLSEGAGYYCIFTPQGNS